VGLVRVCSAGRRVPSVCLESTWGVLVASFLVLRCFSWEVGVSAG
jgi:hypothetical protein